MIGRKKSIQFHKPVSKSLYASVLFLSISLFVLFAYLIYLMYVNTIDTDFSMIGYAMLAILIAIIAIKIILVIAGKIGHKKLDYLKKYKLETRH